MKKLLLLSVALALSGLVAFWIGHATGDYAPVEAQDRGVLFPKVEIHLVIEGIDGEFTAGVSGLGATCEVTEFREGNDPDGTVRKIPGRLKWGDITLKRGVTELGDPFASEMHKWYESVRGGKLENKSGSMILRTPDGAEVARYAFFEAWPCKWKGFSMANADSVFPAEEFVLVVNKAQRIR